MTDPRLERLHALFEAARQVADADSPLGRRARERLVESTGLSAEGVELGLSECLEHDTRRAEISQLTHRADTAGASHGRATHVLLSSNLFVAPLRAIALALAQGPRVFVRPSRRDPVLTQLLHEGSKGAFEVVETLSPGPGDHFWAYGHDATLATLRGSLPPGVRFHGHGSGMGAVVVRQGVELGSAELARAAEDIAQDVVAFDQRGCLSPRLVFVEGNRTFAEDCANQLLAALSSWEQVVPRGRLNDAEQADALRFELTMTYLGSCARAGQGLVVLDPVEDRVVIPPVGRYLQIVVTRDPLAHLQRLGDVLTTVGFVNGKHLPGLCEQRIGPRRYVDVGRMQRPSLDGPVDRRSGWNSELL